MELGLGSAQFDLDYGLTNNNGKLNQVEIFTLLDMAIQNNINLIDTSPKYGKAESIIGQYLKKSKVKICSKIQPIESNKVSSNNIDQQIKKVKNSLKELDIKMFDTLLTHGPDDLLKPGGNYLFKVLEQLKLEGLVKNIGASVYTSDQIIKIIDLYNIDVLQIPINLLDQRLVNDGSLERVASKGISLQARSVFLQGLILEDPENLSPYFNPIKSKLQFFHKYCEARHITPLSAALGFIKSLKHIDIAIVGVTSEAQLSEIITANNTEIKDFDWPLFNIDESKFTSPLNWPSTNT